MKRIIRLTVAVILCLALMANTAFAATGVSRFTAKTYTHKAVFDNCIRLDGVDVAAYQSTINWTKAKAQGVDFAIVRVGYRGYGAAGNMAMDSCFEKNMRSAKSAGVQLGLYFYSQALNEDEAIAEAENAIKWMKEIGYGPDDLELPIFMDYEYAPVKTGRFVSGKIGRAQATRNVQAFAETVKAAGYKAGVYGNTTFFNNQLNMTQLDSSIMVWDAQYYSVCQYGGTFSLWQYSSSGNVSGIGKNIDVDFWYLDPNPKPTPETTIVKSMVNAQAYFTGNTTFTYSEGKNYKPAVKVMRDGMPLIEGSDYKVRYISNSQAGTAYAVVYGIRSNRDYQVLPFEILPSENINGINVSAIEDITYTGSETTPSFKVTDALGNLLIAGEDYVFSVSDNINVGTATVTISLTGNYEGTLYANYNIVKGEQTVNILNGIMNAEPGIEDFNIGASCTAAEDGSVLTYMSSNEKVATISENGTVHVIAPGNTTITVKASASLNFNEASSSYEMSVSALKQTVTTGYTKYSKNENSGSFNMKPVASGGGALSYVVENPAVCRVIGSGRVVILGPGTTKIHVKAAATELYGEGEKIVTVTVNPVDEETRILTNQAILDSLGKTKIKTISVENEDGHAAVTWTKSANKYNVDYFQIWRSEKKSSGFKKIAVTFNGSARYFADSDSLDPNRKYYYKVRGVRYVDGKVVYTPFLKSDAFSLNQPEAAALEEPAPDMQP